nr:alpha-glucan water dikinase 1, chloroplastic-like isoform X2 [Tanacetum cinerariifolium]
MQVKVKASSVMLVEIQITNSPDHLFLHWGGMRKRKENWVLPSRRPEGTKVFNDQALRTPFVKSGSDSFLKVEIDDPAIEAIEFLIVDERQNRWYKDDNKNFYVKVPLGKKPVSNVEVPEELVQIQSYLRWERNGKQSYSPEQEKKEFEEARKEALGTWSVSLDKAAETQFSTTSVDGSSDKIQTLELELEEGSFVGMPFVLRHGDNWFKNNDSDFYVEFNGPKEEIKDAGDGKGTARDLLDKIASLESEAEKSFMHRFNIAADLVEEAKDADELGLAGILVWMRFMATRQLVWNKDYCVKPREISQAQDRLINMLQNVYRSRPQYSELLRMIMSSVGRGGDGDVGQRIRDEILVIQRKNNCKGGMMEEWHQKLHNNTSPDDIIICQALIDYIKSDMDISVYWNTLNTNGITKERLLSYDRAIHNEPKFSRDQKEGLLRDLGHYMRTLKAVHSGADLESAISNCMGYVSEGKGFMVGVNINPISGLPSGFPELLQFVLEHVEDKNVEPLLEGLLEARAELQPIISKSNDRLKDLLFVDIALDSTVRTAIERSYEQLKNAKPEKIMHLITLLLENLILSSDNNEDMIYC